MPIRHPLTLLAVALLALCGAGDPAPSPPASSAEAKATGQACAAFGVQFYLETAKAAKGENLCVSPWSAYVALAMLAEGAKGKTADEFAAVLRTKPDAQGRLLSLHQGVRAIADDLAAGAGADEAQAKMIAKKLAPLCSQLEDQKNKRQPWKGE